MCRASLLETVTGKPGTDGTSPSFSNDWAIGERRFRPSFLLFTLGRLPKLDLIPIWILDPREVPVGGIFRVNGLTRRGEAKTKSLHALLPVFQKGSPARRKRVILLIRNFRT
jgi:hypothetical protein